MEQFKFDKLGYLLPYNLVKTDYKTFVHNFVDLNRTPSRINLIQEFNNFLLFLNLFITNDFKLWIGGSFVTTKINPPDIDMVLILNDKIYLEKSEELNFILQKSNSLFTSDLYLIRIGSDFQHKDEKYWINQYNTDKSDINPKGIIELDFQSENNSNLY